MQVKHLPFMYRCGFLFICTVFSNLSCDLLSPDEDTVEDVTFVANFTRDWLPETPARRSVNAPFVTGQS